MSQYFNFRYSNDIKIFGHRRGEPGVSIWDIKTQIGKLINIIFIINILSHLFLNRNDLTRDSCIF